MKMINLNTCNVQEISKNESLNINGGSAFSDGYAAGQQASGAVALLLALFGFRK